MRESKFEPSKKQKESDTGKTIKRLIKSANEKAEENERLEKKAAERARERKVNKEK